MYDHTLSIAYFSKFFSSYFGDSLSRTILFPQLTNGNQSTSKAKLGSGKERKKERERRSSRGDATGVVYSKHSTNKSRCRIIQQ